MKTLIWTFGLFLFLASSVSAQSRRNDIAVTQLPKSVKSVLVDYVNLLQNAGSLDDCAEGMLNLAGGSLVDEQVDEQGNALSLRSSVKRYSLKKDYDNVKFYKNPIKITRVNVSTTSGTGFGPSALRGKIYKIWIAKKKGVAGMPAPISIIVPEGHAQVKTPKVLRIGSL